MAIERTEPPSLKRVYPHVDQVKEWPAQQTIRLLWERIFDLESRLQASEASLDTLVTHANDSDAQLAIARRDAKEALALAQLSRSEQSDIEEGSHLPSEAPDMFSVVEEVYADGAPGPTPWTLADNYGPTGSSKFVEAVVDALNALDDNWGHLAKTGGQNGSVDHVPPGDGHAVDAINWKNPDGVTAEIYDIVSSSGGIQWNYDIGSRDNGDALANWYYPA